MNKRKVSRTALGYGAGSRYAGKTQSLKFLVLSFSFALFTLHFALAQDGNKLVTLSKQIIEAKSNQDLYVPFEELRELYFSRQAIPYEGGIPPKAGKDNKYNDFVEFLKSLQQQKQSLEPVTNYYIAEARYYQLKHLEEAQNWDEYFAQGNTYRDQISEGAQRTIASTMPKEAVNIYARLLLWRFHKDQEDTFKDSALDELMAGVREYSSDAALDASVLKSVADQLSSYGEKGRCKELYKIYVDKLVATDIKNEDLKKSAAGFYQDGNVELAETLYDMYIERITKNTPKEKLIPALTDIAQAFAYRDGANCDPVYAEKIFKKIEEIGGKGAFNEELIYLRAFNLEKSKEFIPAKENYLELVTRYPKTTHNDESDFKVAIISTYVARDINAGRSYFEKLAQKETVSPQVISSLYQLGLLSQWEAKFDVAKEYYNKLLERAKDGYKETVTLAKERLKEIDQAKPIEYNLKTFLDVSLKDERGITDMTKLDLRSNPYKQKKDKTIDITSHPYVGETGCMQVEVQYLWSGHIGTAQPSVEQPTFNTGYLHNGTKEVNLVVVTPAGILDRDLVMIDID